jgi:phosphoesterase RecJ-like protein
MSNQQKNNQLDTIVAQAFLQARKILITSHVRPDGDAIGAVLGLGLALKEAKKEVQMVLSDGVPSSFYHLDGVRQIQRTARGEFDMVIVVDCSDLLRTGEALGGRSVDLNIDHHLTNLGYGRINVVDAQEVATCAILASQLEAWGLVFTPAVASALLSGLVSDTIGFRTPNVKPDTLRLAANLMEKGANLPELYHLALIRRSFFAARYWGRGLENLQQENGLVWTRLTLQDRALAGYTGNDDADLINTLSSIDDSDITLILIEQKGFKVKVSWRARIGWDVSQLAIQFGGGGHAAAAGAEISGTMEEVQDRVLSATRALLSEHISKQQTSESYRPTLMKQDNPISRGESKNE